MAYGPGAVRDSTNDWCSPDDYAHTLTYDGSGRVATDSFTDGVNTWTMTFTYDSAGNLTGTSRWVRS